MFGHHYFGARYYPPRYFGVGGGLRVIELNDPSELDANGRRKRYGFYVQAALMFRVQATGGATIRRGGDVTSADGYVESADVGCYIELAALSDTEWATISEIPAGSWTVSP